MDIGIATWNAQHMDEQQIRLILEMFAKNQWLDVLVLQEINKSFLTNHLETLLRVLGEHNLGLELGIRMVSLSADPLPTDGQERPRPQLPRFHPELATGVVQKITVRTKQQEVYPLIYRKGKVTIEPKGAFYNQTLYGYGAYRSLQSWTEAKVFGWCKALEWKRLTKDSSLQKKEAIRALNTTAPLFRPIMVYQVHFEGHSLQLGVIHTTPGTKANRQREYTQIRTYLELMNGAREPVILAGDFYLDPQSRLNTRKGQRLTTFTEVMSSHGQVKTVTTLTSTNIDTKPFQKQPQPGMDEEDELSPEERSDYVHHRADFFICTRSIHRAYVGLVVPQGGLHALDSNHESLCEWARHSDHAPVGGIFWTMEQPQGPIGEPPPMRMLVEKFLRYEQTRPLESQARKELKELHWRAYTQLSATIERLVNYLGSQQSDELNLQGRTAMNQLTHGLYRLLQHESEDSLRFLSEQHHQWVRAMISQAQGTPPDSVQGLMQYVRGLRFDFSQSPWKELMASFNLLTYSLTDYALPYSPSLYQ